MIAGLVWWLLAVVMPFSPIPKEVERLYRFNLSATFYPTEEAFHGDVALLRAMVDSARTFKGRVTVSSDDLLEAYLMLERLQPLWTKAYVYAHLRHAVNTEDRAYMDQIREVSGDLASELSFVGLEVAHLAPETLTAWRARDVRLERFAWPIQREMRRRDHLLSLPEEELLARLEPAFEPWPEDLYQACLDRTTFPRVVSSEGETLSVRYSYGQLRIDPDRSVRRAAWHGYMAAMQSHADLYALALRTRVTTKNRLARIRGFSDYVEESLFHDFLTVPDVDSIYARVSRSADLGRAYQELRRRRIASFAQLDTVLAWDMSLLPPGLVHPRWTIQEASQVLLDALGVLGDEYRRELAALLDPANGRLDVVAGPNREPGAFAWGYHGAPWQFFSFSYEGFYGDLMTLAHEAGHAIHYQLLYNHGVPPLLSDGPGYLTEGVAIFNEVLVTDYLRRTATSPEEEAYFLERLVGNAMGVFDIVNTALQERDIYRCALDRTLTPDLLDSISLAHNRVFSVFADLHPESRQDWQLVSHYYVAPMYYVNYVIAQLLALFFFEHMDDASFLERYVSFLSSPFDADGPRLLRERMGVDITSRRFVEDGLDLARRWMEELEQTWRSQGF